MIFKILDFVSQSWRAGARSFLLKNFGRLSPGFFRANSKLIWAKGHSPTRQLHLQTLDGTDTDWAHGGIAIVYEGTSLIFVMIIQNKTPDHPTSKDRKSVV